MRIPSCSMSLRSRSASFVATEDGSVGTKGNVIDAIKENALEAE